MAEVVDHRVCALGEGPLWHPIREQLFWFDIIGKRLLSFSPAGQEEWQFPEMVSAAGWISRAELLIASEVALFRYNIETGKKSVLCELEADNQGTRSNDGRADPQGGFWIGTMGKAGEPEAGSIYRWYRGELRRLYKEITIPNAICFTMDGKTAHFADTAKGRIMRVDLDADGWPKGQPETFVDLTKERLHPDGAVVDRSGLLWVAQWGAGRVAAYDPAGQFIRAIAIPAPHSSCPAFGGPGLRTLVCTTATQGMVAADLLAFPDAGKLFAAENASRGQYEHQVIIPNTTP